MAQRYDNTTVLHLACENNHTAAVEMIISAGQVQNIVKDILLASGKAKNTVIHLASANNHTKAVDTILTAASDQDIVRQVLLAPNENKDTALHVACQENHSKAVVALLAAAVHNNIVEEVLLAQGEAKNTLLHVACMDKEDNSAVEEIITIALEQNIMNDVLVAQNESNDTPLHVACQYNDAITTEIILTAAVKTDIVRDIILKTNDKGQTAIHCACAMGNNIIIECILPYVKKEILLDLLAKQDANEATVLDEAIRTGNDNAVKSIMTRIVNIIHSTEDKPVVLNVIYIQGIQTKVKIIEYLHELDGQYIFLHEDGDGRTVLHEACNHGNNDSIQAILDVAINNKCITKLLCHKDHWKNTVLWQIVENGNLTSLKCLLDYAKQSDCIREFLLSQNLQGLSVLSQAILDRFNDKDCTHILLNEAAQANLFAELIRDTGFKLLDLVIQINNTDDLARFITNAKEQSHVLKYKDVNHILQALFTVKSVHKNNRQSLLHKVIRYCRYEVVKETLQIAETLNCIENVFFHTTKGIYSVCMDSENKNVLHVACEGGKENVTELLIETIVDLQKANPLMQGHSRCLLYLSQRDKYDKTALEYAQERGIASTFTSFLIMDEMPLMSESATKLIERSSVDKYHLFDTGDKDFGESRKHNLLTLMWKVGCLDLIRHEYTQNYLNSCWRSYGRYIFYANFILYILYVMTFTSFIITHRLIISNSNTTSEKCTSMSFSCPNTATTAFQYMTIIFSILNLIYEILAMLAKGKYYWFSKDNYIDLYVYVTSIFVSVATLISGYTSLYHQLGTVTMAVAWVNLAWMFTKIPSFGSEILQTLSLRFIMLFRVIWNVVVFAPVFSVFLLTFALAFHSLLPNQDEFDHLGFSIMKTMAMSIGELDFGDMFFSDDTRPPFYTVTCLVFVVFLTIMSISAMNLLVGMAVGDINELSSQSEVLAFKTLADLTLKHQAFKTVFTQTNQKDKNNTGNEPIRLHDTMHSENEPIRKQDTKVPVNEPITQQDTGIITRDIQHKKTGFVNRALSESIDDEALRQAVEHVEDNKEENLVEGDNQRWATKHR